MPIKNIPRLHCRWDFTNTNGSIVIETNFKINETKTICLYDYLLLATDGEYNILYFIFITHQIFYKQYYLLNIISVEDGTILLKKYCPISNNNDKFIIISPLPMTRLLVRA